jgi:hypothetical protein
MTELIPSASASGNQGAYLDYGKKRLGTNWRLNWAYCPEIILAQAFMQPQQD